MSDAAPAPDEPIHDGETVAARPAATVVLVRDGDADGGLETLLVRRTPRARFMAGAWVFPGGAVDPGDGSGEAGLRAAARREVSEEAGIELDADAELVVFSHWITPERVAIRYDTWFFLARMPAGQAPRVDGSEVVDAGWFRPGDALAASDRGDIHVVFPTRKQLERLATFAGVGALMDHARGAEVRAVTPRVRGSGEQARIVLPGEAGYDD